MEGVRWDGMIKDVQQKTPTITPEITGSFETSTLVGSCVKNPPNIPSHNSTHDVSHFEKVSSPPYQALRAFTRKSRANQRGAIRLHQLILGPARMGVTPHDGEKGLLF